ncbi:hypothetical protein D3C87_1513390 [compost metagenome]
MEIVSQFRAIGADILHRGRARSARDQGQVFEAAKALIHCPGDKVMPGFPRGSLDQNAAIAFLDDPAAGKGE